VWVVLLCFAGERIVGDVEEWLLKLGEQMGVLLLVKSVDLADAKTVGFLLEMAVEGHINFVLEGPPCATWSRVRYIRRPTSTSVRRRRRLGEKDLTLRERLQVGEAILLSPSAKQFVGQAASTFWNIQQT